MYKEKKILALIPARGGSKRLPRKNIKLLNGKPLVAWSIEQALASEFIDRVIVSTNDKEIAEVSRRFGAEIPFIRPEEFAADASLTIDAVIHALDFLRAQGESYDYLAMLEPTSPLRKHGDIDAGIVKLIDFPGANTLTSLGSGYLEQPRITKRLQNGFVVPYITGENQQADEAYIPYGVICLSRVESLYKNRDFYAKECIPLFIERWQNYEVDDEVDFFVIEKIMQENFSKISKGAD